MMEPGGGGVHGGDVVVDCSVDGGRGFEILSLLPSSFLPSFLPAIPGGLRHVGPLMFAQPVWRISVWGMSSGAEFERWRMLGCGMEVEG